MPWANRHTDIIGTTNVENISRWDTTDLLKTPRRGRDMTIARSDSRMQGSCQTGSGAFAWRWKRNGKAAEITAALKVLQTSPRSSACPIQQPTERFFAQGFSTSL